MSERMSARTKQAVRSKRMRGANGPVLYASISKSFHPLCAARLHLAFSALYSALFFHYFFLIVNLSALIQFGYFWIVVHKKLSPVRLLHLIRFTFWVFQIENWILPIDQTCDFLNLQTELNLLLPLAFIKKAG